MINDTSDPNEKIRLAAKNRILRRQQSLSYRSFFSTEAIDAFSEIKGSALAGKSLAHSKNEDSDGDK